MFNKMDSKKILSVLIITLLVLAFSIPVLAAPGSHELITPQQLKGLMNSNNVVVVDIREAKAYEAGHIPSAVLFNKADMYETVNGVKNMAATPEKLAGLLGKIGISPKNHIVVYNAANDVKHATRLWWTLELYGSTNVQVLDGGFEAWMAKGYETSTAPVVPTPVIYPSSDLIVNPDIVATLQEVKDGLISGAVVIDCRSKDFFEGKLSKVARAGHIAGTILIPESDMLNKDFTFKSKDELRSYFAAKEITKKTPIIAYCNTGTTATVQFFALKEILGFKDVQIYDGSLTEWAADPALPMESSYDHFYVGSSKAEVNGCFFELPAAPIIQSGLCFVPADAIATSLGASVEISNGMATFAQSNGKVATTEVIVLNDVTFAPIKLVAEQLSVPFFWDPVKQDAVVYTP